MERMVQETTGQPVGLVKSESVFAGILLALFVLLGFIGITHHEMWRDELQHWLIAKNATGLITLYQHLKYDGHLGGWHLCLFVLSRIFSDPFAMQVFHLAVAAGSVALVLFLSPFTRIQKILFTFGYFPFFEYAQISRNYALGGLFLFTFCCLFPYRRQRPIVISLVLILAAQTSAYGTMLALAAAMTLVADYLFDRLRLGEEAPPVSRSRVAIAIGLFVVAESVSIFFMMPTADSYLHESWRQGLSASEQLMVTLSTVWMSYVPIPDLWDFHFWNTNILTCREGGALVAAFCGAAFMLAACACFLRKPTALFMYLCGTVGMLVFIWLILLGFARHHGHLFLWLVATCWVAHFIVPWNLGDTAVIRAVRSIESRAGILFTALLCGQAIAGAYAFAAGLTSTFSAIPQAARTIQRMGLDNRIVAGNPTCVSSATAYLDKPIFFLGAERYGTYAVFDKQWKWVELDCLELQSRLARLWARERKEIVLLLNRPLMCPNGPMEMIPVAGFPESVVEDEAAFVYLVRPSAAASTSKTAIPHELQPSPSGTPPASQPNTGAVPRE